MNARGSEAPEPTWKLTPTTFRSSSFARANSPSVESMAAPNLRLKRHKLEESSVEIRKKSSAPG